MTRFDRRYSGWVSDNPDAISAQLQIHIFGAYIGECKNNLETITENLRKSGYTETKICINLSNKNRPAQMKKTRYNWLESVRCMDSANVAVFIFFNPDNVQGSTAGLNTSVVAELVYWSHFFDEPTRDTLIIFETDPEEYLGSLIDGVAEARGISKWTVDEDDDTITACTNKIRNEAMKWADDIE